MRKCSIGTLAIVGLLHALESDFAAAADFSQPPVYGMEMPVAPAPAPLIKGGRHWAGHHDYPWEYETERSYFSNGWGSPWYYEPATEPYRPRVAMPDTTPPMAHYAAPEPWTKSWYAYCASKYRSFEPETGLYSSRSGGKRHCR